MSWRDCTKPYRRVFFDCVLFGYDAGPVPPIVNGGRRRGMKSVVEFKKKPGGRVLHIGDTKPAATKNSAGPTEKPAKSTSTKVSGGTRSSPPRVGGDGSGEAKGEKAKSAESAKKRRP
jgi:hypothetical protein